MERQKRDGGRVQGVEIGGIQQNPKRGKGPYEHFRDISGKGPSIYDVHTEGGEGFGSCGQGEGIKNLIFCRRHIWMAPNSHQRKVHTICMEMKNRLPPVLTLHGLFLFQTSLWL